MGDQCQMSPLDPLRFLKKKLCPGAVSSFLNFFINSHYCDLLLVFSYLVVSLETSNKGLHVGDFVMKTDRIWMNCTAIGKSCITVKEKIRKLKT